MRNSIASCRCSQYLREFFSYGQCSTCTKSSFKLKGALASSVPAVTSACVASSINPVPASDAFRLSNTYFKPAGWIALVLSVPVCDSAAVASSTIPLTASVAATISGIFLLTTVQCAKVVGESCLAQLARSL